MPIAAFRTFDFYDILGRANVETDLDLDNAQLEFLTMILSYKNIYYICQA